MSPEIIQKALEQVLSGMKAAAMKGKAGMFAKPTASPGDGLSPDDAPPDAQEGLAGAAAADALGDADDSGAEDPAEEADPNDPTDDELEALMQK